MKKITILFAALTLFSCSLFSQLPHVISQDDTLWVHPEDNSIGIQWYNGAYIETYALSDSNGRDNTDSIVKYQGEGNYAAYLCDTLNAYGYNDWYLPAENELIALYQNKDSIGMFDSTNYWSSTEIDSNMAKAVDFANGANNNNFKDQGYNVRCVRRNIPPEEFHIMLMSLQKTSSDTVCDGSIDVYAEGGSGEYTYVWSTGDSSNYIYDLCQGWYGLTVTDTVTYEELIDSFYIDVASPPPYIIFNGDTLWVHPDDNEWAIPWSQTMTETFAIHPDDGVNNTQMIIEALDSMNWYAAKVCDDLFAFGFNDWYLPAENELIALYQNKDSIGMFDSTNYWSSTEIDSNMAKAVDFANGANNNNFKDQGYNVRCVRRNIPPEEFHIMLMSLQKTSSDTVCDGSIDVYAEGGSGEYTYVWSTGDSSNYIYDLCQGWYGLTVTDTVTYEELIDSFYIDVASPPPYVLFNGDTLWVHPDDNEWAIPWSQTMTETFAIHPDDGVNNTQMIIEALDSMDWYAAKVCDDLFAFGFNDWYLPAENELIALYQNKDSIGMFDSTNYWSSTEIDSNMAKAVDFANGANNNNFKDQGYNVRCVRRNIPPEEFHIMLMSLQKTSSDTVCDGSIDVYAEGGSGEYMYVWSTGDSSNYIYDLCQGWYGLTVTDTVTYEELIDSFYIDVASPPPYIIFNGDTLWVHPDDNEWAIPWSQTMTETFAIHPDDGVNNTQMIIEALDSMNWYAAKVCDDLFAFGFNDWYLPAENELIALYQNKDSIGMFDSTNYWSSTEIDSNMAKAVDFANGANNNNFKDQGYNVRCVRRNIPPEEFHIMLMSLQKTSSDTVCDGSIDVYAEGGSGEYTYVWSTGDSSNYIYDLCQGWYGLTVTDTVTYEELIDSFYIDVMTALMVYDTIITDVLCYGDSTGSIQAFIQGGTPPYIYEWDNGITAGPTMETETMIDKLMTGSYTLIVTDDMMDSDTISFFVSEPPSLPFAHVTSNSPVCSEDTVMLSEIGGDAIDWQWTGPDSFMSNEQDPEILNATEFASGIYNVTITDANGCTSIASGSVTVFATPMVMVNSEEYACEGGDISLGEYGGDAATWQWSGPEGFSSFEQYPVITGATITHAGNYEVMIEDANGCTASDMIMVTVAEEPDATITASSTTVDCNNDSVTLSVLEDPELVYEWSSGHLENEITVSPVVNTTYFVTITDIAGCTTIGSQEILVDLDVPDGTMTADTDTVTCLLPSAILGVPAGNSYAWSNGATTNEITVSPSVETIYTVTITGANGCTTISDTTVMVNDDIPNATITVGKDTLCANETTTLSVVETAEATYLWSTAEITTGITVQPDVTTTYTITVTASSGCTGVESVELYVLAPLTPDLGDDKVLCEGSTATLDPGITGPYAYSWSTGEVMQIIDVISNGTYTVTILDAYGCEASDSVMVSFHDNPIPELGEDQTICEGASVVLDAGAFESYLWNTSATTPYISVDTAGTYSVLVTDINGCTGTAETTINTEPLIASMEAIALTDDSLSWVFTASIVSGPVSDPSYTWQFPATTMSGDSITRNFLQARELEVCLTAQGNVPACSYSVCETILIGKQDVYCEALFSHTLDTLNQEISLMNESDRYTNASWSFGDGNISTVNNPTHFYPNAGTYDVCLSIADTTRSCQATTCKEVLINQAIPNVIADFDYTLFSTQQAVMLYNQSLNQETSYWRISNDTVRIDGQDTLYTFGKEGLYRVCLNAENSVSVDRKCQWIEMSPIPCDIDAKFNFFANPDQGTISFANASSGNVNAAYWDFGNGSSSSQIHPGTRNFDPGTYLVTLSVQDTLSGCMAYTGRFIQLSGASCQAAFGYMNAQSNPATIRFDNRSQGSKIHYLWDFGDGRTSREVNPEHTYNRGGSYVVTLHVSDSANTCQDVAMQVVEAGSVPCMADFVHFVDSASRSVNFTSRSIGDSLQHSWILGDGSVKTGTKPSHQFARPGHFSVTLFVQEPSTGCVSVASKEVMVSQAMPVTARFDYFVGEDGSVQFTNRSMGSAIGYIWSFGDTTAAHFSSFRDTIQKTYTDGRYTACLTALGGEGVSHIRCHNIEINTTGSETCKAAFVRMVEENLGSFLNYSDMGEDGSSRWYVDGQEMATGMDWQYEFPDSGFYRVSLEIETSQGCRDMAHQLVVTGTAAEHGIKANFAYEELEQQLKVSGYPVDFVGIAHGDASRIRWEFGDGHEDSTNTNPTHYYEEAGLYTACYTVEDPITGLSDRYCEEVKVGIETGICPMGAEDILTNIELYPNPASDQVTIKLEGIQVSNSSLHIVDSRGTIMDIYQLTNLTGNKYEISVSVNHYATGKYYLILDQGENGKVVKSFIKE